jgi:hypothetical protein
VSCNNLVRSHAGVSHAGVRLCFWFRRQHVRAE